jgi:hypothetical protein
MEAVVLIVLGAILATYGWYWGGVTDGRTTAIGVGAGASILAGLSVFRPGDASTAVWSIAALGAVMGGLAAIGAYAERRTDRTAGLFGLYFGLAAALAAGTLGVANDFGAFGIASVLLAVVAGLVFVAGALVPQSRGYRAFVGWVMLVAGAAIGLLGYLPGLGVDF